MFERTEKLNLSTIKEIELRASRLTDVVSLAQGIPSFDTPECIKRRVERALKRGAVAKYSLTPGLPELRELIEISLAKEGIYYDWENEIIVTAGSIEAISASILALTNPGDEIIIPNPTYTSYQEIIKLAGCVPVSVPLHEESDWSLDLEELKNSITNRTKAIFFCNPNNPTGTILKKELLLEIAKIAEKYNLFIITDEVYKDFVFNKEDIFSLAEIVELRKKVIRIFSFSKAYAMTGWRVAYLHSDKSVVKEILKVHDSLVTCAPVISQYAAMGALEMGDKDIDYFKQEYKKRRDLVCGELDKMKKFFSYVKPAGSYFVFPKLTDHIPIKNSYNDYSHSLSWQFVQNLLEHAQVALVPGIAFGSSGECHVRINFGRNEKDLRIAFDRIKKYLCI